jgi:hypothetical protein
LRVSVDGERAHDARDDEGFFHALLTPSQCVENRFAGLAAAAAGPR